MLSFDYFFIRKNNGGAALRIRKTQILVISKNMENNIKVDREVVMEEKLVWSPWTWFASSTYNQITKEHYNKNKYPKCCLGPLLSVSAPIKTEMFSSFPVGFDVKPERKQSGERSWRKQKKRVMETERLVRATWSVSIIRREITLTLILLHSLKCGQIWRTLVGG